MKKILLSTSTIALFIIYTLFLRAGDISAQLFKIKNTALEPTATNQNVTSTTSTSANNVTRQTNCVYIPADKEDEENFDDEVDEDGIQTGHYKCTTIIVPIPVVQNPNPEPKPVVTKPTTKPSTAPTPTPAPVPVPVPVVVSPPPVIKPKNSKWNDGTFIGDSIDAYYGYVQVSVTIANDKMTSISFLDYPQDRKTSLQKSNYSMPQLKSEAISKQTANVNSVSGATYTSEAFVRSLSSALAQAKI